MSLTIAQMDLAPVMERRARELDLQFPGLIAFISGRRTVHAQASAMASNHLLDPKTYLMNNYMKSAEFLYALREAPTADSIEEVTEVFYALMIADPTLIRTPHFLGNAVDLRRMEEANGEPTPSGRQVIAWIKACPDTVDFRTREGKLRRWHWACAASKEV